MSSGEIRVDCFDIGPEPAAETKLAALRTVCGHSADVAEVLVFAQMLGLSPSTVGAPVCPSCERPMSRRHVPGYVTRGGEGLCTGCYSALKRLREREA